MKKLILILFVAAVVTACHDSKPIVITEDQYKKLYVDSGAPLLMVNNDTYPVYLGSDGHYYYTVYIATGAYTGHERPFHLGGCNTCKKQQNPKP